MRYRKPKIRYGDGEARTFCTVDGFDYDDVLVTWHSSPAEDDVNWPGSFEITGVYTHKKCREHDVIDYMTPAELDNLTMRMQEIAFPDDDGDY